ncbi:hypothetical protein EIP91_004367 [Steccherinum ochraceum]|uniref:C2H2-type domain-containing protein n=1 Tax=Steccherinum ochraceum TaxID=92696 RepID=A0A4R0RZW9_9APHY|nr:hypothetical protein EIP91_004367 [Steccherinum ochraceum]
MSDQEAHSEPPEVIDLTNLNSDSDSDGIDPEDEYADVEPLSEHAHTQLHIAIASLDQVLLRQMLADLIDEEPYVARALYNRFATDEDEDEDELQAVGGPGPLHLAAAGTSGQASNSNQPQPVEVDDSDSGDEGDKENGGDELEIGSSQPELGEDDAEPPPASMSTCINCEEDFDVNAEHVDGECTYHPGHLYADESKFVDWDEDVHGPMDTPSNRRDYPDNFTWSCCKEDGESEGGCREGFHEAGGSSKKRARIG